MASTTIGRTIDLYLASREKYALFHGAPASDQVAVVNWIGYDAPDGALTEGDLLGVVNRNMAESGGDELADDVARVRAARDIDPHLTVVGNSYGSTTSAISADVHGLAADDLILTGSPGAGDAETAGDLTTGPEHTWIGSASHDFVTALGSNGGSDPLDLSTPGFAEGMGNDPADEDFDAQRFTAEHPDRATNPLMEINPGNLGSGSIAGWSIEDHQRYDDAHTESLDNISRIVVGDYDGVVHAEHRYDPLVDVDPRVDVDFDCAGVGPVQACIPTGTGVHAPDVDVMMQDPERDRTPTPVVD